MILGVFLFWVFLTWNRTPSFCDRIEINSICNADSSTVSVSIKHPYFSLNKFKEDFCGFFTDYGSSVAGVSFVVNQPVDLSGEVSSCDNSKFNAEDCTFFKNRTMDSIGAFYEFRARKELFGNMDARDARNLIIEGWDDKGFCLGKKIAKYEKNICVDTLRMLVGVNKFSSLGVPAGYNCKMYYTLIRLLRLEDISQFNYSLVFNGDVSRLSGLEVDFGGPVDIKGLWPTPDVVEPSRIIYLSEEKISQVKRAGAIKMFCQSLETLNIQNVRLFLLTTLSSLCMAYSLKGFGVFVMFCWRRIRRKYKNRKKESKSLFETMRAVMRRLRKIFSKGE